VSPQGVEHFSFLKALLLPKLVKPSVSPQGVEHARLVADWDRYDP